MECSFFFAPVILSTYQWLSLWGIYFFFPSVNFGNEMHLSKTAHGNTATDSTTVSYRQCSLWARLPLLAMRTKLRLRGRGLLLKRCLIFFFFLFCKLISQMCPAGFGYIIYPRKQFFPKNSVTFWQWLWITFKGFCERFCFFATAS